MCFFVQLLKRIKTTTVKDHFLPEWSIYCHKTKECALKAFRFRLWLAYPPQVCYGWKEDVDLKNRRPWRLTTSAGTLRFWQGGKFSPIWLASEMFSVEAVEKCGPSGRYQAAQLKFWLYTRYWPLSPNLRHLRSRLFLQPIQYRIDGVQTGK